MPRVTLVVLLVLATTAATQVSVVPTDIQMPGTQPGQVGGL